MKSVRNGGSAEFFSPAAEIAGDLGFLLLLNQAVCYPKPTNPLPYPDLEAR